MVDIWSIVEALSPIIAPVVSLVLVVVGRIIWNHEQRIRELERSGNRQSRTLYGDEKDDRQNGVAQDVEDLETRMESVEKAVYRIERHVKEINGTRFDPYQDGSDDELGLSEDD